jgi:hypothetical protein
MQIKYEDIRPGDRVTIRIPNGLGLKNGKTVQEWAEKAGRCVFVGPAGPVLNMGGRFGTPGVATPDVFVKATGPSRPTGESPGLNLL